MKKGIVINQTILLFIAIFSLAVVIVVYIFFSDLGGDWLDAIRKSMAFQSVGP